MTWFVKRPIKVRAVQFLKDSEESPSGVYWDSAMDSFMVATLEGAMIVEDRAWIVTGIKGEQYPVREDIFMATYEPVRVASEDLGPVAVDEWPRGRWVYVTDCSYYGEALHRYNTGLTCIHCAPVPAAVEPWDGLFVGSLSLWRLTAGNAAVQTGNIAAELAVEEVGLNWDTLLEAIYDGYA